MIKYVYLLSALILVSCSGGGKEKDVSQKLSPVSQVFKIETKIKGDIPPEFYWEETDGSKVSFKSYSKGKTILVNFWATWCGPCRKEIPDLIKLQEMLKDKNFEVIGISVDNSADPVVEFLKEIKVNYKIIYDATHELLDAFGGSIGIPTSFLIGPDGKIHKKYIGARTKETFLADISKILK